ncbi:hypothetical protein SSPO_009470 [Streptomyces antimycoticus]|uniref:Uncharacterized protein n=1 Tax=Streptomyces antimycoticus TaxID=68175 RepID=A0A499UM62_9ACTN|nr:hypothetical protein SSPO_009470 [Streptomyces antimycoticus]
MCQGITRGKRAALLDFVHIDPMNAPAVSEAVEMVRGTGNVSEGGGDKEAWGIPLDSRVFPAT